MNPASGEAQEFAVFIQGILLCSSVRYEGKK